MSARTNIATTSPANNKKYPIVLGKSFFQQASGQRPTGFVSATYRFKPSSVDESRTGHITFDTKNATLQFDRKQQGGHSNNSNSNATNPINFSGASAMAQNREFFLWFDASNQRMVMEKCGVQIKHLSHSREVRQSSLTSYNDKSKDRLKQFEERHKKKVRGKGKTSKTQNKRKTNIKSVANSSSNNMDKQDAKRSQSRSMSKSISPINPQRDLNHNNQNNNNNNNNHDTVRNNNANIHHSNRHSGNNGSHPAAMPRNTDNAQYRNDVNTMHMNASAHHTNTNAMHSNHNHNQNNNTMSHNNANNYEEATAHNGPTSLFGNAAWADDSDSEDDDIL
mmetsp:Transcript_6312/g.10408  ORF Transcript_6312/g.10408 Transcript_6312/m.10408 type:complete len:336 (+) Transcript_6312:40-1047(+)|eukprot:CAMPEP_0197032442 /NCGR_PEP_ID=MMETSP1384-20130603/11120_1 /TAXON_ID=29189 /ORGANISM="Ammonia sp." /LENGTH=335 /DNA_ID=CAMNT_0042462103 /DNA_START=31 /DNA_END=1038 /DNA_ORIENTATION=-